MSQLVVLPNILWTIKDLTAAHKISCSSVTFMGMQWKLTLSRSPDITVHWGDTFQLSLKRLSPVLNTQIQELQFCVDTSIIVNHVGTPKLQKLSYVTMGYPDWWIWNYKAAEIAKFYSNFSMHSAATFLISVKLYKGSSQLLNLADEIERQVTRIPLCTVSLAEDLGKLFCGPEHNDIVLKCDETLFHAHRAILSARSEVFAAMFRHDMKEARDGIVHITDMEPSILEQLLSYLYTGQISDLSADSVCKIHAAADKYRVETLAIKCALFVADKYTESNECTSSGVKEENTEKQQQENPQAENTDNQSQEIPPKRDTDDQLQKIPSKEKLLKELFLTLEWKTLAEGYPKLASEMCRPLLTKETF